MTQGVGVGSAATAGAHDPDANLADGLRSGSSSPRHGDTVWQALRSRVVAVVRVVSVVCARCACTGCTAVAVHQTDGDSPRNRVFSRVVCSYTRTVHEKPRFVLLYRGCLRFRINQIFRTNPRANKGIRKTLTLAVRVGATMLAMYRMQEDRAFR